MLNFQIEQDFADEIQKNGYIAGVDEAGRGALAGPVVAAAVIFPTLLSNNEKLLSKINDSKKLSQSKREKIYAELIDSEIYMGIGIVDNTIIDKLNILKATFVAMTEAVCKLEIIPNGIIIDGNRIPPNLKFKARAVVKGDAKSISVAAASIIAKVTRDHIMINLSKEYPEYEWNINKGYGTARHYELLQKYGPCPYHRKTFKLDRQSVHVDSQFQLLFPNL